MHHHEEYPSGELFSFQIKRMARGYCVQSSNWQERVPGMATHPCSSGTSAHGKGQEMNHVLGEAAAKHAVNRNQGNAHQVTGDEMGKEFMKPGGPVQ